MDVLWGSIDVRDLLSAQEVEESSPLSAPDLRLLIDRLQIRSLEIKDKVRSYILSHHRDFSEIFSRCSQSFDKTDQIARDVENLLSFLSDRPLDLEIRDLAKEICTKKREFEEKKEALRFVRVVASFVDTLRSARQDLKTGKLIEAARALRDLKADGEEKDAPKVFCLLQEEWRECFDEVQEALVGIIQNTVLFEPDKGRMRVKCHVSVGERDGLELQTVFMALEIIEALDYGLAKVADLMIKHVIIPTIANGLAVTFVVEKDQDFEEKPNATLNLVTAFGSEGENLNDATIYSTLIQIVKFIYESICSNNGKWMRCFGRLTWPRISDLVITNFLSKAVPDDASKFPEFQKIIKLTVEFETALKEMEFISATHTRDEKLSIFAQNVEVHFASRKRDEILAKVRNLLLQSEFVLSLESPTKGGSTFEAHGANDKFSNYAVDLLFQSGRCIVSKAASQLMELVHQVLQDVCLSSTRVALEFYHVARDALLLYEAIIPIKLEKQFDSINQVAVLIHNDCLYLSSEILGLAFEYRSNFPSYIKENAVFVDMVPKFYQMAEEILDTQIKLVISNLNEAIDGADGFQNTHQMQQYESAKFSIDQEPPGVRALVGEISSGVFDLIRHIAQDQRNVLALMIFVKNLQTCAKGNSKNLLTFVVVFILEKVRMIWDPLLLPSTYKRLMCIVLGSLFSRITQDILQLDDMAADETLQLQRLIHFTLENLYSLFESLVGKEKILVDSILVLAEELLPSLRKLRKLADLLDMPLKSITTSWESGELVNCGFTASEVHCFVKAIFTDSPLRKECLLRIERASTHD